MKRNRIDKDFDCVEMKHRLQERIYVETKGMTTEEYIAYINKRITNSQFAWFLKKEEYQELTELEKTL